MAPAARTVVAVLASALLAGGLTAAQEATTIRVSVAWDGAEADGSSDEPALTPDGRFVAFRSAAGNLVPGDGNGARDVFVRDRWAGTTTCASVEPGGQPGNGASRGASISADGRWVAFLSSASDLVPGDANGQDDVFVRDLQAGTTARASVGHAGQEAHGGSWGPALSAGGRCVVFTSASTNLLAVPTSGAQVFLRDLQHGATTLVSVALDGAHGDGLSGEASISADGSLVAFSSSASDLVSGPQSAWMQVYVRDRGAGTTRRVSVSTDGDLADRHCTVTAISPDGRFVAFVTAATNLVPGDTNFHNDVYVHDQATGVTRRASLGARGQQAAHPADRPSLSAEGRYVAFESFSGAFVPGDTNGSSDVLLRDLKTLLTTRVSLGHAGQQGHGHSLMARITPDGRHVVFTSAASDLVAGDTNRSTDVFVRDRGAGFVAGYCTAKVNSQGCASSMTVAGTPSASSGAPCVLGAVDVLNQTHGLLLYGHGHAATPFRGGTLCVAPPTPRTPLQASGGNAGPRDCSGSFAFDMNAHIQSGVDPGLHPVVDVFAQYWSRDPGDPTGAHLTDAVTFRVEP